MELLDSVEGHPQLNGLVFSDSGATILDHWLWTDVCGSYVLNWRRDMWRDTLMSLVQCGAAAVRRRRNNTWIATFWPGWASALSRWPDTLNAVLKQAVRNVGPIADRGG